MIFCGFSQHGEAMVNVYDTLGEYGGTLVANNKSSHWNWPDTLPSDRTMGYDEVFCSFLFLHFKRAVTRISKEMNVFSKFDQLCPFFSALSKNGISIHPVIPFCM